MAQDSVDPVLIAGAGPAGLALALTLVKNGIPVRVISKAAGFHKEQRGMVIQPRTEEVFHFLGVLMDIQTIAMDMQPLKFYKFPGGKEVLATCWVIEPEESTPARPFNWPIQVPQYHTEAVLRSHLAKHGCQVELNTEIVDLRQFDDRVEATIKKTTEDGEVTETKQYRWLIGADGGKSLVRKRAGLSFDGAASPEKSIIGEVFIEGLDSQHWHIWAKTAGGPPTILLVRATEVPGQYWLFLSGSIDPDQILESDETFKKALRDITERDDLVWGKTMHVTDYRPSVRMVNKFREGRIFVAGDAAHVHTPRGGQGLNSSVQDALNLGWKLALVEKGLAPPSLLDTYSEERSPVIKQMLQETADMTRAILGGHSSKESLQAAWQRGTLLKQFGINYRWSSIVFDERYKSLNAQRAEAEALNPYGVGTDSDPVRAGDRAPNATGLVRLEGGQDGSARTTSLFDLYGPTHHTVLVFGPDPTKVDPVVEHCISCPPNTVMTTVLLPNSSSREPTVENPKADALLCDLDGIAHREYGITQGQSLVVIVRPDGFVGAVAQGVEGVAKYFGMIFARAT